MKKNHLIGISIIAVVLLVFASFTNVVGYKTVASSDNKVIKDEVDQKELLFQTIIDLANNKEIQSIIQNSDIKENFEKSLKVPGAKLLMFELRIRFFMVLPPPPVLTKNYLDYAYKVSVRRLKNFDASRFNPILENLQVNNQEIQKEITAVIEKDAILSGEITQLLDLSCDCENNNTVNWNFPIICLLLFPLVYVSIGFYLMGGFGFLMIVLGTIGMKLNCFW